MVDLSQVQILPSPSGAPENMCGMAVCAVNDMCILPADTGQPQEMSGGPEPPLYGQEWLSDGCRVLRCILFQCTVEKLLMAEFWAQVSEFYQFMLNKGT